MTAAGTVDLYVVDAGTSVEDALPRQIGINYALQTPAISLTAGSYDIYITTTGEKTVLDGPVNLEVSLGDVFEAVLLDRVDPALAEFKLFPLEHAEAETVTNALKGLVGQKIQRIIIDKDGINDEKLGRKHKIIGQETTGVGGNRETGGRRIGSGIPGRGPG